MRGDFRFGIVRVPIETLICLLIFWFEKESSCIHSIFYLCSGADSLLAMSLLPGIATSVVSVETFPPVAIMDKRILYVWGHDLLWAAAVPQLLLFQTLAVPSCEECLIPALPEEVLVSIVNFAAPLALFYHFD